MKLCLGKCQFIFTELDGSDCLRKQTQIIILRFQGESHGVVLCINKVVGKLKSSVQAAECGIVSSDQLLQIIYRLIAPAGRFHFFKKVFQILQLPCNDEASHPVCQIIGA